MTPRDGSTDELRAGMYFLSRSTQEILRVDGVTATEFLLTNKAGVTQSMPRPWDAKPVTIMEPTPEEALSTVERILGVAQVVGERTDRDRGFVVLKPLGTQLADWHTHMFLLHGIWTKSGPGSRSLAKIMEGHEQDHLDAEAGRPTGHYVKHVHPA